MLVPKMLIRNFIGGSIEVIDDRFPGIGKEEARGVEHGLEEYLHGAPDN
jgi:hypothetical protein